LEVLKEPKSRSSSSNEPKNSKNEYLIKEQF